jgi:hypothetical protein
MCCFFSRRSLGLMMVLAMNFPLTTLLQANADTKDDPFETFHFAVKDANGRRVNLHYDNGQVTLKAPNQDAEPISAAHGIEVPAGSTAEEINRLLHEHRIVYFSPKAVYKIDRALVIPPNTFIDFREATLKLKDGANAYLLRNGNEDAENSHIILRRGRLHGNAAAQTRNYNGDYRTGYFGFGTAFTKLKQLVMQDFHVEDTNAWGVAYFLCDTVRFLDFTFDQSVARGKNGDGITGIARRVYVDTIRGYTNDDMVAVSTGKGTLQGNDIGITSDQNIDVESVVIRHLKAISKEGQPTHVGVGLYPTAGHEIHQVRIEGLEGDFDHAACRLQNYWPKIGEGFFGSVHVSDVVARSTHLYVSLVDVKHMGSLTLERHQTLGSEKAASLLTLSQSSIGSLIMRECHIAGKGSERLLPVEKSGKNPSSVGSALLDRVGFAE